MRDRSGEDESGDEVEEWTINAVSNDIMDAQIDQIQEQINIKSHKLRCLNDQDWEKLKLQVQTWKTRFQENFVQYLEVQGN